MSIDRTAKRFRTAGMTPKTLTRMYLIWCHCQPLGWQQSYTDVAEALGLHYNTVARIAAVMGWQDRFRLTTPSLLELRGGHDPEIPDLIEQFRSLAAAE